MTPGQIIAFAGGGFTQEPENPLLDDYVLGASPNPWPRVCFVPTASGDNAAYVNRFYEVFDGRCEPTHLSLFSRSVEDLWGFFRDVDIVYAGGGNTLNLIAVWRAHGLDAVLREAMTKGTILAGVSAGALCWFERGLTDSYGPRLASLDHALGFLPGSFCPHLDSEPRRRSGFREMVRTTGVAGIAGEDGVALHYVGDRLTRVVTSRPGKRAWRFTPQADGVKEEAIEAEFLGSEAPLPG